MTQAMIGVWYKKKYGVPHYLYVTDLWPENVESVTGIHSRLVINPIQRMVDNIYKNTDYIFTCSKSFIPRIEKRGISKKKIEYWPQYAEEFYKPLQAEGALIPQDGVLNFVFAGSVGYAQGLDILVKAAVRLKHDNVLVRFDIIGDGRYLDILKNSIKTADVGEYFNFISRKPAEEISNYLAFADALLITLSKNDVFAITLPAKVQSCFACGKPIIVSADGEAQLAVNEAKAGLCSDAEDVNGFVKNIKAFIDMSQEQRGELSRNALDYAMAHFDKKKQMDRLDEVFTQGGKLRNVSV
jgi:glycosyltransferase involved in cell wall biosynthesis